MGVGEIKTITEDEVYKQAEVMLLRQISDNLKRLSEEAISTRVDLSEIKVDIAVMKERQDQSRRIEETCEELRREIDLLKARNLREDGAVTFLTFLKDFGPWIAGLLALAWSLFGKK